MEKNVGKTVTLNYVLQRLSQYNISIAVTSIGIDGEGIDQVTNTAKPEIILDKGVMFSTSEQHYHKKQLLADIIALSEYRTSLGRIVTAKALSKGKALLSGPSDTTHLVELINNNKEFGIDITIVDGALSRKSLAAPSVTEAMILATGAAYSINPKKLIKDTAFLCSLIRLNKVEEQTRRLIMQLDNGIYAIENCTKIQKLNIPSAILFEKNKEELFRYGNTLYINGIISDKLLSYIRTQKHCASCELIVKDFTQLFITPETYSAFVGKGGIIKVLNNTHLLAVTFNPTSPNGYSLDSATMCAELSKIINSPVYDIMEIKTNNTQQK